ncbi:MAG: ABC transporter ATP-binding protein [Actinobacteria bacterium]|nr:ABC transporter ATP-binding protein [Actinomycetota bacterium]
MHLLEVEALTKRFGGLIAVNAVNFRVDSGQIKAIIGPNGAGKTTVFNLLTGIETPTTGTIKFESKEINRKKPHQIAALGISRTFQNTRLFPNMTAVENVMLGRHTRTRTEMLAAMLGMPAVRREDEETTERAEYLLRFVGLDKKANVLGDDLPQGERRLLEIARALATEPKLILLDEPAAGLNNSETAKLAEMIYKIRDLGMTILLVEHDMGLVMEVSDDVVVLNYGKKIAEGPPLLIREDEQVVQAYLGQEIANA